MTPKAPTTTTTTTTTTTVDLLRAIRDMDFLTCSTLCVLNALVLRGNHTKDFHCYPSRTQLSLDTRMDRKTVRKALTLLVEADFIQVQEHPNQSPDYFVNVKVILSLAAEARRANGRHKRVPTESPFQGSQACEDLSADDEEPSPTNEILNPFRHPEYNDDFI